MKKILSYLWQLPQNILGLALVLFYKYYYGCYNYQNREDIKYYFSSGMPSGISLGRYIILDDIYPLDDDDSKHEFGHTKQSKKLGWLYLLIIGLPSLLGNVYSRIFNKNSKWYYNQPWEKWADKLGEVKRNY